LEGEPREEKPKEEKFGHFYYCKHEIDLEKKPFPSLKSNASSCRNFEKYRKGERNCLYPKKVTYY
jgi:hypothetical protein